MDEKIEKKIKELHRRIGDAERKLKDAPMHERAIIEVGLDALRKELSRLYKKRN